MVCSTHTRIHEQIKNNIRINPLKHTSPTKNASYAHFFSPPPQKKIMTSTRVFQKHSHVKPSQFGAVESVHSYPQRSPFSFSQKSDGEIRLTTWDEKKTFVNTGMFKKNNLKCCWWSDFGNTISRMTPPQGFKGKQPINIHYTGQPNPMTSCCRPLGSPNTHDGLAIHRLGRSTCGPGLSTRPQDQGDPNTLASMGKMGYLPNMNDWFLW